MTPAEPKDSSPVTTSINPPGDRSSASPGAAAEALAGTWRRFVARSIDLFIGYVVVGTLMELLVSPRSAAYKEWTSSSNQGDNILFGVALLPLVLLFDALVATIFGNTPAKAIFGIRVRKANGQALTLADWVRRNARLWGSGLGFGIPLVNLITAYRQQKLIDRLLPTSYDASEGNVVTGVTVTKTRRVSMVLACILTFVGFTALNAVYKMDALKAQTDLRSPPYTWNNPTSGLATQVDAEWTLKAQVNEHGQPLYVFNDRSNHAVVILAHEEASTSLHEYVQLLITALSKNAQFDSGGSYQEIDGGVPSWRVSGSMSMGVVQARVLMEVRQNGNHFWRVLRIQQNPVEFTDTKTALLAAGLWNTVPRQAIRNVPGDRSTKPQS